MSVLQILAWPRHQWALNHMSGLEQFSAYIERLRPPKFLAYQRASNNKRLEFLSVMEAIGIDPQNRNFLDLGPAYGDSLDLCHERGAKSVSFTEIDPFFFTYNRLKKFTTAYRLNHLSKLHRLPAGIFDLIWAKGSVVADHAIFSEKLPVRTWRFSDWLMQLEKLTAPRAHIVICPHWRNDGKQRRIQNAKESILSNILLSHGYEILPEIPGHNHQPEYPLTYHKIVVPR